MVSPDSQAPQTISIVIPVYNGEAIIGETLASVAAQDYPAVQTIVVDDASTDGTVGVCETFDVELVRLADNAGPANARNVGVVRVTGDIVLFIDTGVILVDPSTVRRLVAKFEDHPEIAGVTMVRARNALNAGITPAYWATINYYEWMRAPTYHTSFATERSAIRTSILREMELFDSRFRGADIEDHEFGFRLHAAGHKVLVAHDIEVADRFDTLCQATKKMLVRSFHWFRLFVRRRKFDSVWNTQDRAAKTLVAGTCLPLAALAAIVWQPLLFAGAVALCLAFLFYTYRFYLWLGLKAGKPHLIFPFVFLDLYISSIILMGATWSLLDLLIHRPSPRTR